MPTFAERQERFELGFPRGYSRPMQALLSDPHKRVLVVDDNADAADLLAEILRAKGLDVAVARTPSEALALVLTFLPDVALLDIGLPEMSGYELARRIRQAGSTCRLVAVTGYGDEHARSRVREAGFTAHLVKPVTVDRVLSAITASN